MDTDLAPTDIADIWSRYKGTEIPTLLDALVGKLYLQHLMGFQFIKADDLEKAKGKAEAYEELRGWLKADLKQIQDYLK